MAESFLEKRRRQLQAGEQTVPLDFRDLREMASEFLPGSSYQNVRAAAGSERTKRTNDEAYDRVRIVPRVLRDVSTRSLETELFGETVSAPVVLAPIGGQTKYHEDGELGTASAAGATGIPMVLSNSSSYSFDEVAEAYGDGLLFYQLYWPRDWEVAESVVNRAESSGFGGIVLTVDAQIPRWMPRRLRKRTDPKLSTRTALYETDPVVQERAAEAGQSVEDYVSSSPRLNTDASITWDDLDTLRDWTDLPIVVKGILDPQDAERAADRGVDGIVVSNHGGRQIDGEISPLEQLQAIVDVVPDDLTVLVDSGVRSGSDVFKAVAIGADAVLFGRPYIYGLSIAGETGVRETVMNCLAELESVMGFTGRPTIEHVGPDAVLNRHG